VRLDHGYVEAKASRLTGAEIVFDTVTAHGTENVMLAATLARGTTRLVNAAREPKSRPRADADGDGREDPGAGTETIEIEGWRASAESRTRSSPTASRRAPTSWPPPRRAETSRCAGARRSTCRLTTRLAVTGVASTRSATRSGSAPTKPGLARRRHGALPRFPTDLQAQWTALATGLEGVATITETIFENRFQHVAELVRMGAGSGSRAAGAVVEGPSRLAGATVMASDLRASAALAIAALAPRARRRSTASTTWIAGTRRWRRS
jgi:UDP-N-acetylglucosamine 1-carboxyvinyltransferase